MIQGIIDYYFIYMTNLDKKNRKNEETDERELLLGLKATRN